MSLAIAGEDGDGGGAYTRCLFEPTVNKLRGGLFTLRQAVPEKASRPNGKLNFYLTCETKTRKLLDLAGSDVPSVFESEEAAWDMAPVFRRDLDQGFAVRAAARQGAAQPSAVQTKRRKTGGCPYDKLITAHRDKIEAYNSQIKYLEERQDEHLWEMIKGAKSAEDVTKHSLSWVQAKATVVLTGWRLLRRAEEDKLSAYLRDPNCDPSKGPLVHRKLDIANLIAQMFGLGERTVRGYWTEFENGWTDRADGVFSPDQRGTHKRETLLDHGNVRSQLKLWMETHIDSVSVDTGRAFINRDLLPKIDKETRAKFGVSKDVCRDTAWRWMTSVGATVKPEAFYADVHQNLAVIEYRDGTF